MHQSTTLLFTLVHFYERRDTGQNWPQFHPIGSFVPYRYALTVGTHTTFNWFQGEPTHHFQQIEAM